MIKSTTYDTKACCGHDCYAFGLDPKHPCWGPVQVIDESWDGSDYESFIHACSGHADAYDGNGKYIPEPE